MSLKITHAKFKTSQCRRGLKNKENEFTSPTFAIFTMFHLAFALTNPYPLEPPWGGYHIPASVVGYHATLACTIATKKGRVHTENHLASFCSQNWVRSSLEWRRLLWSQATPLIILGLQRHRSALRILRSRQSLLGMFWMTLLHHGTTDSDTFAFWGTPYCPLPINRIEVFSGPLNFELSKFNCFNKIEGAGDWKPAVNCLME